jgi:general secretion pathway protein H
MAVKHANHGFTLIELLVMLVIIGLFAGLISSIIRPDERVLLQVEAERLAQLLDLAGIEARMSGKSIAWTANEASYRFWSYRAGTGWSEIHKDDLFRQRTLPQGMKIGSMLIEAFPVGNLMRLEFNSYGSMPAYAIKISLGAERYTVEGSPVGDVRATPEEKKKETDGTR